MVLAGCPSGKLVSVYIWRPIWGAINENPGICRDYGKRNMGLLMTDCLGTIPRKHPEEILTPKAQTFLKETYGGWTQSCMN